MTLAPFLRDGRAIALLLSLGSIALLTTAFYFEYVRHLLPCELCLWQRKPHFIIIPLGLVALAARPRLRTMLLALMAVAAFTNMGIGIFHVGVEHKWWEGLSSCRTASGAGLSVEELRTLMLGSTAVPCDRAVWFFLGLSMAGWNALISLGMGIAAAMGARLAWRAK